MRHRVKKSFFNRDTKHRQAMLRSGVRNLLLHGEMITTPAKAKEYKRLIDKIIHKALDSSMNSRRNLHEFFGKRDVVNTLVDKIAPIFKGRQSGFTRITKYGFRRGDNAEMVKLELVVKHDNLGTFKKIVVEKEVAEVEKTVAKKPAAKKAAPKAKETVTKKKDDAKESKKTK